MAVKIYDSGSETTETTFAGATLATYEINGPSDSDWWAVVWDERAGRVVQVQYATTRGWTYNNGATVDAGDDVKGKAEAWLAAVIEHALTAEAGADAVDPTAGKRVRSLTTRGKNVGVEGYVMRREANPYRTYHRNGYNHPEAIENQRVVVQVDGEDRPRYLDAVRVEVVDPAPVDPAGIRAKAARLAAGRNWMAAFYPTPLPDPTTTRATVAVAVAVAV